MVAVPLTEMFVLVALRIAQANFIFKDEYIHAVCMSILLNLSPSLVQLSQPTSLRLVRYSILCSVLGQHLKRSSFSQASSDLFMVVVDVICAAHTTNHQLVYSLLQQDPFFGREADIPEHLRTQVSYLQRLMDACKQALGHPDATNDPEWALGQIKNVQDKSTDMAGVLPLHAHVEVVHGEFLLYIWSLVYLDCGLYWGHVDSLAQMIR